MDSASSYPDGSRCVQRLRAVNASEGKLLDHYLIREKERGGAVCKLHEVHAPIEIIYFTQDSWLFAKPTAPFMVAHRSLQLTMPSGNCFCVCDRLHIIAPPLHPVVPVNLILPYSLARFGPNIETSKSASCYIYPEGVENLTFQLFI